MALGIVKYFYYRPSQPIEVIWFVVSLSQSVVVYPRSGHVLPIFSGLECEVKTSMR